jgi:glycosyltransferase involved in cell wall biosynthesis
MRERAYGYAQLPALARAARACDLIHVFNPRLFYFSALHSPLLRGGAGGGRLPIVYSVVGGVRPDALPFTPAHFRGVSRILVSSPRDARALREAGYQRVQVIQPGINLSGFEPSPAPPFAPGQPFKLVCASAPWNESQFRIKGIDALIAVAEALPNLHLTFLWRGVMAAAMEQRMARSAAAGRIALVNAQADVAAHLRNAHAAALVSDQTEAIKPYPHSLMESLACARPALISQQIPLSEDVAAHGCGVVVKDASAGAVREGIVQLMAGYAAFAAGAASFPLQPFSRERWVGEHLAVYGELD